MSQIIEWRSDPQGFIPPAEWAMVDTHEYEIIDELRSAGWRQSSAGGKWVTFCRPLPISHVERREAIWRQMRHLVPAPGTLEERNALIDRAWTAACGGRADACATSDTNFATLVNDANTRNATVGPNYFLGLGGSK